MSSDVLLALDGLTWTAPGAETPLFKDLAVELRAGEVLSPTGPSGCGKTSLLRAMALLLEGAAGSVMWRGEAVQADGVPTHRRQVALVAQDPAPVRGTVHDDLDFALDVADAAGVTGDGGLDSSAQAEMLERLGLGELPWTTPLVSLSGGERRRVALVRALTVGPTVLLLDEPTTGLDPDHVDALVDLLLEWKGSGRDRALAWVTHDAAQRDRVATRVLDLGSIRS